MKILHVVGARPNFMKVAPLVDAVWVWNNAHPQDDPLRQMIIHTGQHYDEKMSKLFFDELEIPKPDINLEVGSASHAVQTAEIMKRFEPVLINERPDYVLVVGDVNSTIACSLVAVKHGIKVAHVEAGLRSFDRSMPEEINRILTDAIADLLFVTEESGIENLRREGIPGEKIYFVGNVMIDTLRKHWEKASQSSTLSRLGLVPPEGDTEGTVKPYGLLTLHRPSNVDDRETFRGILEALTEISKRFPIIFPIHPRTMKQVREFGFQEFFSNLTNAGNDFYHNGIHCIEPQGYLDFLRLVSCARLVLTDSGGIQEETTVLGVPCVTLRESTERPVTVTLGTNIITGTKRDAIIKGAQDHLATDPSSMQGRVPPLWDGKAAERIVSILADQKG